MKRYLVFYGDSYYPCGGFEDVHFWVDDLKEADPELSGRDGTWAHAVDTSTWAIIKRWTSDWSGNWKACS